MILRRSNCGQRPNQNDVRKTEGEILSTNHKFSVVVALAFISIAIQYADDAYGATNDKLDVNLNVLYVATQLQKDSNPLSEIIIQFPFPLSENARNTGQGPFGGATYFDTKTLVNVSTQVVSDNTQLVSEMGLGENLLFLLCPGGHSIYVRSVCNFFPSVFV
jgi:hypothetical protein